jgi:hypothetical protein
MAQNPLAQLRASMTRDQQIALCYRAGRTIYAIASAFDVTPMRVNQILKKQGITRDDNPKTRNKQLYAFVGANIEQHVKDALVIVAKKKHMSISAYIKKLIEDDLIGVI